MIAAIAATVRTELAEFRANSPRAQQAYAAALAVVSTSVMTDLAALPDAWWAAISAFMTSQATQPDSLRRAVFRFCGTAIGAVLGLLVVSTAAYDHVFCAVCLLSIGTAGLLGFLLSTHGYTWLYSAITALMIILSGLEDPDTAFTVATYRTLEVIIGSSAAVLMACIFTSGPGKPVVPTPGFVDLYGANWPATFHALRGGITVALIPLLWTSFDLPGGTQMAVTATAIMAVAPGSDLGDPRALLTRALQRILGCVVGGAAGLVLISIPLVSFLPWLLLLGVGVFICMYLQTSPHGYGYVGTQAAVAYMMTLIQGLGPPTSILPGIERLVGMTGGLLVLLLVSFVLWPTQNRAPSIRQSSTAS